MPGDRPLHQRTDGQLFTAAAAAVARGDDLDDCLAELLGLAAEHFRARSGAAYILDQDRDELELAVTYGIDAETVAGVASSFHGHIARPRNPVIRPPVRKLIKRG